MPLGRLFAIGFLGLILIGRSDVAQTPGPTDVTRMARELRAAIEREELSAAADLAAKLDDAVQAQYRASLTSDVNQRVEEALTWLPPDTESLWINQEPFKIDNQPLELLWQRPTQVYSIDRLSAVNGGRIYRALTNRTIRLVVAAARNIRDQRMGIPSPIPRHDVAYLYFFHGQRAGAVDKRANANRLIDVRPYLQSFGRRRWSRRCRLAKQRRKHEQASAPEEITPGEAPLALFEQA